ncbi:MAG: hypothetical protein K0Q79_3674 [Flavipsychrobacter sp.]|nr:hypothetical protein [Flavipsychrobacter sp.]
MRTFFRSLCLFIACCGAVSPAYAQKIERSTDTVKKAVAKPVAVVKPKGPKAISKELSFGIRLNSNGWSLYSDIGTIRPRDAKHADMFYNVRLWQVEFTEKKHQKEAKSTGAGSAGGSSNSYIYGKINNFYALKLGRGYMRMLAGKPDPGSVSIHWLYAGGFSLGMLKPYYLNVYSDPNAIKYDDDKEDFLDQYVIQDNAGFAKGLGEMKYVPGFHVKSAIHFDFSANRKSMIGVEAGVNAEYYTQDVQIMANQKPSTFFIDLYLAFQVGKRW